jgi:arylsulfatase A-like enzyme
VAALLFSSLLTVAAATAQDRGAPRPNILFILADDLGRADVSFNGGELKTPNIDRIRSSGARLDQFYVQPVCSPTRAALMTGRYPMRHGLQVGVVRPWAQYGLPLDERTLPQALKEAGYQTAIAGKWHLGHFQPAYLPTRRGFDHQYGHYNGALDYNTHVRDGGFDWHRDDRASRDEGYTTHLLAREAVLRIRERDKRRPFFLYVPFNAVHTPHQVPAKYTEPYGHLRGERRTYAGMLAAMDEGVGQILDALEREKLAESTMVIFSSDNGGPGPGVVTDNGPFRAGKGTLYEGGVRVAACVSWPKRIRAGSIVDEPLHMVDWYPMLLRLAGASPKQALPLDGLDAWATITQGKKSPHDEILLNTTPRTGAIRVGDWKLVLNGTVREADGGLAAEAGGARAGGERIELFDLAADPYERNNLASREPDRVRSLRARYERLAGQAVPPRARPRPAGFRVPSVWGE